MSVTNFGGDEIPTIDLVEFISGVRHELRRSVDALQDELNRERTAEAGPTERKAIPVFMLEGLELNVACSIVRKKGVEVEGKAEATVGGALKILLGLEGKASAGAKGTLGRENTNQATLRLNFRPREAYWDVDGWKLGQELFLSGS